MIIHTTSELGNARYQSTLVGSELPPTTPETALWQSRISTAGGSLLGNSFNIANRLSTQILSKSYNDKIIYLLPLLGADLIAARVPLRDTLNVGIAGVESLTNSNFSQGTGLSTIGEGYLDTLVQPPMLGLSNNGGFGYWEGSFAGSVGSEAMGVTDDIQSTRFTLDLRDYISLFIWGDSSFAQAENDSMSVNGHYYGQRASSTQFDIFLNGSLLNQNTTLATTSTLNRKIYLMGKNINGTGVTPYAGVCKVAYMTDGTMTEDEAADFHSLLTTYLITPTGRSSAPSVTTQTRIWNARVLDNSGTLGVNSFIYANNFSKALLTRSYRYKIKYLLPFFGSNINAAMVPLVDQLNVGTAVNNGFLDADFSESSGVQNNSTKFINTLVVGTRLGRIGVTDFNNGGLGYWEGNFVSSAFEVMGANVGTGGVYRFCIDLRTTQHSFRWCNTSRSAEALTSAGNFHYYGQQSSDVLRSIYVSGLLAAVNTVSDPNVPPPIPMYVLGCHYENGDSNPTNDACKLAYMTDGLLTDAEILDFHGLLTTYIMTPTGR